MKMNNISRNLQKTNNKKVRVNNLKEKRAKNNLPKDSVVLSSNQQKEKNVPKNVKNFIDNVEYAIHSHPAISIIASAVTGASLIGSSIGTALLGAFIGVNALVGAMLLKETILPT